VRLDQQRTLHVVWNCQYTGEQVCLCVSEWYAVSAAASCHDASCPSRRSLGRHPATS